MDRYQLIKEIDELLTENGGRMPEQEVCRIFNIASVEIPWGYKVPWGNIFQANQTFDLIQIKKGN